MTLTEKDSGVAHIRFSEDAFNPREFYGVFFNGVLQPEQFGSWLEAREHLVVLLNKVIEGEAA